MDFLHNAEEKWKNKLTDTRHKDVKNQHLIEVTNFRVPSFDLPRAEWLTFNRVSIEQRKRNY